MVFNYRILRYPKAANLLKYTRKSTKATEILEEKKWMEFPIDNDLLSS